MSAVVINRGGDVLVGDVEPLSPRLEYVYTTRGCASGTSRTGVSETTGEKVPTIKHLTPEAPRHQQVS
jgi:hypothetical protein